MVYMGEQTHWEIGLWVLFLYLSFTLLHFSSFSICISIKKKKLEKKQNSTMELQSVFLEPVWRRKPC